jgi:hypothetical protein
MVWSIWSLSLSLSVHIYKFGWGMHEYVYIYNCKSFKALKAYMQITASTTNHAGDFRPIQEKNNTSGLGQNLNYPLVIYHSCGKWLICKWFIMIYLLKNVISQFATLNNHRVPYFGLMNIHQQNHPVPMCLCNVSQHRPERCASHLFSGE